MRRHTNGGYQNVVDELWRQCEAWNTNIIIMYQNVACKNMATVQGILDEQGRERGYHLIWIEHDLMDPRTVSPQDHARQGQRVHAHGHARRADRSLPLRFRRRKLHVIFSTTTYIKEFTTMKYYGGCDVGSTYTKAVILDENGKICADTTIRSKINSEVSAKLAMEEVLNKVGLNSSEELGYLIGTGYGRNKVPFADENISEISCHAMGVHVTDPSVKAIIDIGGQDVKGISIDTDGTVKNFAMNDKCAAGTGRFYEAMARSFEMTLPEFSNLSLTAKNVIPITAQCTVFHGLAF